MSKHESSDPLVPLPNCSTPPRVFRFTATSLTVFILLGVIRGTTPLMLSYACQVISSSMAILLRSPITLIFLGVHCAMLRYQHQLQHQHQHIPEGDAEAQADRQSDNVISIDLLGHLKTLSFHRHMLVMAILQQGLPFVLFGWAVANSTSSVGGVMMATTPLVALALSKTLCLKMPGSEKLNWCQIVGMISGLVGVIMILFQNLEKGSNGTSDQHNKLRTVAAYAAALMGVLLWALASLYWAKNKGSVHYAVAGFGTNMWSCPVCLVIWVIYHYAFNQGTNDTSFVGTDWIFYFSMTWVSFSSGYLAMIMIYYLFDHIGPVKSNEVLYLVPVVSLFEDVIINKIWANTTYYYIILECAGCGFVIFGLWLTTRKPADFGGLCRCSRLTETRNQVANDDMGIHLAPYAPVGHTSILLSGTEQTPDE